MTNPRSQRKARTKKDPISVPMAAMAPVVADTPVVLVPFAEAPVPAESDAKTLADQVESLAVPVKRAAKKKKSSTSVRKRAAKNSDPMLDSKEQIVEQYIQAAIDPPEMKNTEAVNAHQEELQNKEPTQAPDATHNTPGNETDTMILMNQPLRNSQDLAPAHGADPMNGQTRGQVRDDVSEHGQLAFSQGLMGPAPMVPSMESMATLSTFNMGFADAQHAAGRTPSWPAVAAPAVAPAAQAQRTLEVGSFHKQPWVTPLLVLASIAAVWAAIHTGSDPAQTVEAALTTLIAASIASIVGFAFAAIAGVGYSMIGLQPEEMIRLFAIGSVTTQFYSIAIFRHAVPWEKVKPVVLTGLLAAPLGVYVLRSMDPQTYLMALGSMISLYAVYMLRRKSITAHFTPNKKTDVIAGALSGLVGGFAALPVTTLAIYSQLRSDGSDPVGERAFYQTAGTIVQVWVLILLLVSDIGQANSTPGLNMQAQDLFIIPIVLLATQLGLGFFKKLQGATVTKIINVMLLVSGVSIVAKQLLS